MDGNIVVTSEHILAFFTGADKIPPRRLDKKATMVFTSGILATASTCDMVIRVPYCHGTYDAFESFIVEALIANGGFDVI